MRARAKRDSTSCGTEQLPLTTERGHATALKPLRSVPQRRRARKAPLPPTG
ncbi:hypothetical protein CUR178_02759 [Leishmania enriettii]|uniref:Uncharacterized protein n=1 Tax=Leishmania enriettii TaxID=5663 RepID=A0A836GH92_LEIEN|nr:hypothetical protein CUR178_02759 [Leishmania enriettii]